MKNRGIETIADHQKPMEEVNNGNINQAVGQIWMNSRKDFLEEMRRKESQSLSKLRQQLMKQLQTNTPNTRHGELIGATKWGGLSHFASWRKKHVEKFTEGYDRIWIGVLTDFGTRGWLVNPNEFRTIIDYLYESCPRIEGWHSFFNSLPVGSRLRHDHPDR